MATNEIPKSWVLQYRGADNFWRTQILPANQAGCTFARSQPEVISISAVNRFGNISPPAAVQKISPAPQPTWTPPPTPKPAPKIRHMGKTTLYD